MSPLSFNTFMQNGDVKGALLLLLNMPNGNAEFKNDITYLLSTYENTESKHRLGIISIHDYDIKINKITYSVILIGSYLEDDFDLNSINYKTQISLNNSKVEKVNESLGKIMLLRGRLERINEKWDTFYESYYNNRTPTLLSVLSSTLGISLFISFALFIYDAINKESVESVLKESKFTLIVLLIPLYFSYKTFKYAFYKYNRRRFVTKRRKIIDAIDKNLDI